jgi:hypothetical protein
MDKNAPAIYDAPKVMVVLLYNLAVLCHITAIREGEQLGSSRCSHILETYQTALQVVASYWDQEDVESMLWLLLAISNNIGHIHSNSESLNNFQETREIVFKVTNLLTRTSPQRSKMPLQEYKTFFESVFIFLEGTTGLYLAPAA